MNCSARETMKYIDQTKFGDDGNCFAACVASLLGLSIEDVPCFNVPGKNWLRLFEEWLKPRGLVPLIMWGKGGGIIPDGVHYLAGGKSPRGIPHSVIYYEGEMVHDPHPSRAGLVEISDYTFLVSVIICPVKCSSGSSRLGIWRPCNGNVRLIEGTMRCEKCGVSYCRTGMGEA